MIYLHTFAYTFIQWEIFCNEICSIEFSISHMLIFAPPDPFSAILSFTILTYVHIFRNFSISISDDPLCIVIGTHITEPAIGTKLPETNIWPTAEKCWQHGRYSRLSGKFSSLFSHYFLLNAFISIHSLYNTTRKSRRFNVCWTVEMKVCLTTDQRRQNFDNRQ